MKSFYINFVQILFSCLLRQRRYSTTEEFQVCGEHVDIIFSFGKIKDGRNKDKNFCSHLICNLEDIIFSEAKKLYCNVT